MTIRIRRIATAAALTATLAGALSAANPLPAAAQGLGVSPGLAGPDTQQRFIPGPPAGAISVGGAGARAYGNGPYGAGYESYGAWYGHDADAPVPSLGYVRHGRHHKRH